MRLFTRALGAERVSSSVTCVGLVELCFEGLLADIREISSFTHARKNSGVRLGAVVSEVAKFRKLEHPLERMGTSADGT